MTTLDHSMFFQPATAPMQQPQQALTEDDTDTMSDILAGGVLPSIRITRMFDVRRVLNSETELRLSFDVPAHFQVDELQVTIERRDNNTKQPQPEDDFYTLRVAGTNCRSAKTFPWNAQSMDLQQMRAVLHVHPSSTTNELEVICPKTTTTTTDGDSLPPTNPLVAVLQALQALAISVSQSSLSSWNEDRVVRKIPIATATGSEDRPTR